MLWVHCAHQDYMDPEASHDYRLFESMKQANEWVERMKEAYTSGDVWIIGPATHPRLETCSPYSQGNYLVTYDKPFVENAE